jgi:hypothetical protein
MMTLSIFRSLPTYLHTRRSEPGISSSVGSATLIDESKGIKIIAKDNEEYHLKE